MQERVWAKTILEATYQTIKRGGEIPPHVIPAIERALEIMKREDKE